MTSQRIYTALRSWSRPSTWRLARKPSGGASPATIARIVAELEELNGATERDFLAIGEKLLGFRSAARRVAADILALTDLISGVHGRNASLALARMLEHSESLDRGVERSAHALGQVSDLSKRVRLSFSGLRSSVSVFRTLCTLTRIETSRLGDTGEDFGDLASEVIPLSEAVQSSGEQVLAASAILDQGAQLAAECGSSLRARQLTELPALIAIVVDGLKSFEEKRQRAVELSARQAALYEGLSHAIENVVTSLQFHDITRQQVEHIVEALQQLRCGQPDTRVLALQSAQLASVAHTFASSIARIETDLEDFAARVQQMADATGALMGISAGDRDSFFLQMEAHFTGILRMLDGCSSTESEMNSTAANLRITIAGMRESVMQIRKIEAGIQRISINATLRATHIGAGGDPLNVIAAAMLRLAGDSNVNTENVASALDQMVEAACCASSGSSDTGTWMDEIRGAVAELRSSSESSSNRLNEIASLAAQLATDIGSLRNGFSAGPLFAQVVNRARLDLDVLAAQAGQAFEIVDLENLAARYTMQAERDVHESVLPGSQYVSATPLQGTGLEDGDLGQNVELF